MKGEMATNDFICLCLRYTQPWPKAVQHYKLDHNQIHVLLSILNQEEQSWNLTKNENFYYNMTAVQTQSHNSPLIYICKNNCILSEDYVFYCLVDIPTARSLQTATRHRRFHIYITFITDVSPILSQGPGWLNELMYIINMHGIIFQKVYIFNLCSFIMPEFDDKNCCSHRLENWLNLNKFK
jgi:hypothetical protein